MKEMAKLFVMIVVLLGALYLVFIGFRDLPITSVHSTAAGRFTVKSPEAGERITITLNTRQEEFFIGKDNQFVTMVSYASPTFLVTEKVIYRYEPDQTPGTFYRVVEENVAEGEKISGQCGQCLVIRSNDKAGIFKGLYYYSCEAWKKIPGSRVVTDLLVWNTMKLVLAHQN